MAKRGIVVMGQSNGFYGYAEDMVDSQRGDPRLFMFRQNQTTVLATQAMDFYPAVLGQPYVSYSFYMVRDYLVPQFPGVDFCILPLSLGGSGFVNHWGVGDPQYETAIVQINAFLAAEVGNTIDVVILQNGEDEVSSTASNIGYYATMTDKDAYNRYVTEMIADMTSRVTGGRTWPFLIGQVPPDLAYPPATVGPPASGEDWHNSAYIPFFEAQRDMPASVTNCLNLDSLYPTKVLTHDAIKIDGNGVVRQSAGSYWLHSSQVGHHVMAHRAFKAYMKLKGYGTPITLGYVAPAPVVMDAPSLDLAAGSDTGSSSTDNITTDTTPDIICTFVTPVLENDIIRLKDGVTELVAHVITAGEIGSLSLALGLAPLAGGAHSLTASHERGASASPYSSALVFTVDVTAPIITSSATTSVNEGVALSYPLTASETVTWAIVGGADAGSFGISGTNLTLAAKDYETQAHSWVVQVQATDAADNVSTPQEITVTIDDVPEDTTPPVIDTPATANVDEGVPLAITLTATDASSVTWTKTGGADTAEFEISGTTLRWLGNGTKAYTGIDDVYVVQVTATDFFSNATNKTITVTVLDVVAGGTARSFSAEGISITGTAGAREWSAEGVSFVES